MDVGTNAGSAWTRPSSVPSHSDTVLVTSYTFDAAGRVYEVTDPKALVSRTEFDALGRTTKTIENYVNGTVSDADDEKTAMTNRNHSLTVASALTVLPQPALPGSCVPDAFCDTRGNRPRRLTS